MLVFGDASERVDAPARCREIIGQARLLAGLAGMARRNLATEIFIDAAALAQGLIDAEFAIEGRDRGTPLRQRATALVMAAARLLAGLGESGEIELAGEALLSGGLEGAVSCKRAEGYAFYALYPEAYLAAARMLPAAPAGIIGIRSIGLGLAALVAAAAGQREVFSVRPVGPPFTRQLSLAPAYRARMLAGPGPVAIADEGPGLSGSSFAAVIDALAAGGLAEERIHLFPSHGGSPGSAASPENLGRWQRLRRHVVDFDQLFLGERPQLQSWFADSAGPAIAPLEDISGGGWRRLSSWQGELPPAHMQQERRKFLLRTQRGTFLLKFVGLGRAGREAARRAELLGGAGFTPEALAFVHGFLAERWQQGTPLSQARLPRDELVRRLADYLAFRAKALPAGPDSGADMDELGEMLRVNGAEALGAGAAPALDRLAALRPTAARRRIMTDNRLHAWEWLVTSEGQLVKTDAVDHCAAHDLIGCQDVAWDVAGATLELALSADERQQLLERLARRHGISVGPALLGFFDYCYPAFQLGHYTMAAAAQAGAPEEQQRLAARAAIYRDALAARL